MLFRSLSAKAQSEAAHQVVQRGLSVRETENLVRRLLENPARRKTANAHIDPDIRALMQQLTDKIGAKVSIRHTPQGKGRLVVEYNNLDELEGVLSHIR